MPETVETMEQAWQHLARGEFAPAAAISARRLERRPDDVSALSCLAMSNWQMGIDVATALRQLRRAAELAPKVASIRHNLATVLASTGDHAGARRQFLAALELRPDDAEAFYGLSQSQRFAAGDPMVQQMRALYSAGEMEQGKREFLCFGLAKAYADLGQHDVAMQFCLEANWLAQRPYDATRPRADLAELRRLAAADAFRGLKVAPADPGMRPVFIVGMPRSGTTLVESVLARHPAVHAGGEMLHMVQVEQALLKWMQQSREYVGGPHEMLLSLPADFLARNAAAVRQRIEAAAGRKFSVFTDKLPENSQRLGLIARLFPNTLIIHVRRQALDCCISNLFQRFALGHGFAFRQELLGERYCQVAETMQLWRQALDLPILTVSYEALVSDPEPQIRRIVNFAGLDWDAACLTPEEAGRSVLTASQFQVKQKINRGSVDRWRPYAGWIGPLVTSLGGMEWIEAEQEEIAGAAFS